MPPAAGRVGHLGDLGLGHQQGRPPGPARDLQAQAVQGWRPVERAGEPDPLAPQLLEGGDALEAAVHPGPHPAVRGRQRLQRSPQHLDCRRVLGEVARPQLGGQDPSPFRPGRQLAVVRPLASVVERRPLLEPAVHLGVAGVQVQRHRRCRRQPQPAGRLPRRPSPARSPPPGTGGRSGAAAAAPPWSARAPRPPLAARHRPRPRAARPGAPGGRRPPPSSRPAPPAARPRCCPAVVP